MLVQLIYFIYLKRGGSTPCPPGGTSLFAQRSTQESAVPLYINAVDPNDPLRRVSGSVPLSLQFCAPLRERSAIWLLNKGRLEERVYRTTLFNTNNERASGNRSYVEAAPHGGVLSGLVDYRPK